MRGTVETPSCLLYVSPATQLWTLSPVRPRGAFEGDQAPGILPVSLGVVGSQGAWPVTSGSSSRLVSGSWGGSQGAAHLSPGCPSLPHERTRPPGSLHHPRSPPCRLWPDTGPPRTGRSGGREVGGEQGNARAITRARRRFVMVTECFHFLQWLEEDKLGVILPTPPLCRQANRRSERSRSTDPVNFVGSGSWSFAPPWCPR